MIPQHTVRRVYSVNDLESNKNSPFSVAAVYGRRRTVIDIGPSRRIVSYQRISPCLLTRQRALSELSSNRRMLLRSAPSTRTQTQCHKNADSFLSGTSSSKSLTFSRIPAKKRVRPVSSSSRCKEDLDLDSKEARIGSSLKCSMQGLQQKSFNAARRLSFSSVVEEGDKQGLSAVLKARSIEKGSTNLKNIQFKGVGQQQQLQYSKSMKLGVTCSPPVRPRAHTDESFPLHKACDGASHRSVSPSSDGSVPSPCHIRTRSKGSSLASLEQRVATEGLSVATGMVITCKTPPRVSSPSHPAAPAKVTEAELPHAHATVADGGGDDLAFHSVAETKFPCPPSPPSVTSPSKRWSESILQAPFQENPVENSAGSSAVVPSTHKKSVKKPLTQGIGHHTVVHDSAPLYRGSQRRLLFDLMTPETAAEEEQGEMPGKAEAVGVPLTTTPPVGSIASFSLTPLFGTKETPKAFPFSLVPLKELPQKTPEKPPRVSGLSQSELQYWTQKVGEAVSERRIPARDRVCQITSYLFLGPYKHAKSRKEMEKYKITHILNCASGCCAAVSHPSVTAVLALDGEDSPTYPILQCLWKETYAFLSSAKASVEGRVYLHCKAGVNRSATLAIAAVMAFEGFGLLQAVRHVFAQRRFILTNEFFHAQLVEFAAAHDCLDLPVVMVALSKQRQNDDDDDDDDDGEGTSGCPLLGGSSSFVHSSAEEECTCGLP